MRNSGIVCLGVWLSESSLQWSACYSTDLIATTKAWKDQIQQEMSWMDLVRFSFVDAQ